MIPALRDCLNNDQESLQAASETRQPLSRRPQQSHKGASAACLFILSAAGCVLEFNPQTKEIHCLFVGKTKMSLLSRLMERPSEKREEGVGGAGQK